MTTNLLAMFRLGAMVQQEAHQPPSAPFTLDQAHRVVQFHVACRAHRCPRKAAALATLVEAGRLVLSTTKPR